MSFAICRMQKFKMRDVKGIQIHNQREKESHTNPDIEKEQSHLNYDLHNDQYIDYLRTVKEKIEQNVETNRAIRKDAVVMCEFIVTSDRDFFERLSEDNPEYQKEFFEEAYSFLKERYGEQNIIHAAVHLDEKTPHMHVGMVPVTEEKKLSAKQIFNRKELVSLQDDFHAHMVEKGFNLKRGVSSDKKHIETTRLKALTAKEEVQVLEDTLLEKGVEKQQIEKSMEQMKNRLNDLKRAVNVGKKVENMSVKEKGGLIRSKTVEIGLEDFQRIKTLAKASEAFKRENETLQRQNHALKVNNTDLHTTLKHLEKEKKELEPYKAKYERLQKLVAQMQEFYKERVPQGLEKFQQIVGYCKKKVNITLNPFSNTRFSEKNLTEHERKGYDLASKDIQKKTKEKNRNRDSGLER
ncbi:MobV family relaxase [Bacillus sp. FSL M7-1020]|nr:MULTISPECIES: MobV family relaxase [Bacillus cereus group]MCU5601541.1 plasmid recombination protein [Bacillus wiedmannii]MED3486276.1 MobV family relaxase [Bacillus toyonensis]